MKQKILIILNIIGFSSLAFTQCTLENIFPVEHGAPKFKASTTIASLRSIIEDKEKNKRSLNYWYKPGYLKGDSVFKTYISYDYLFHDCFKGDENELTLSFVDDKLYTIQITLTFSNTKFETCMENYNTLVAIFKDNFIDWSEFVTELTVTKEQIGEGYSFFPTTEDKRNNVKIEELNIGYAVKYELSEYGVYRTGNVDKYIIEIAYYNLKGTKLTNEGY